MARRLFAILGRAIGLALLLVCVAAAALWARSYEKGDYLKCNHHWGCGGLITFDGRVRLSTAVHAKWPRDLVWERQKGTPLAAQWILFGLVGFDAGGHTGAAPGTWRYWGVTLPLWLVCVLTGVPAVALLRPWRWRRRRPEPDKCPVCGYDLRATPERCPECGTEVRASAPACGSQGAL